MEWGVTTHGALGADEKGLAEKLPVLPSLSDMTHRGQFCFLNSCWQFPSLPAVLRDGCWD